MYNLVFYLFNSPRQIEETSPVLVENYIDMGALYYELKDHIKQNKAPLKPLEVFKLLKVIYEVTFTIVYCYIIINKVYYTII